MDNDIKEKINKHIETGKAFTYDELYELCGVRENVKKLCEFYATRMPPYGFYSILIRMNLVLYAIKMYIWINCDIDTRKKWLSPLTELVKLQKSNKNIFRTGNKLYFTTLWAILCTSDKYGALPKKLPNGTIPLVRNIYTIANNAEIDDVFEINYTSIL